MSAVIGHQVGAQEDPEEVVNTHDDADLSNERSSQCNESWIWADVQVSNWV